MKTVSTSYYQWEHGKRPRGRGQWAFTPRQGSNLIPRDPYPITWSAPDLLYSEAVKALPPGEWVALP